MTQIYCSMKSASSVQSAANSILWWAMLLFTIKAITFIYRFIVLLAWTAYLEGSRDVNG